MNEIFGYNVFFLDESGTNHLAGKLVVKQFTSGRYQSSFLYSEEARDVKAFPDLCPYSLSRSFKGPIDINRPDFGIPYSFEDSVPDSWGRALLIKSYGLTAAKSDSVHLLEFLESPIGSLSFQALSLFIEKSKKQSTRNSLSQKIEDALSFSTSRELSDESLRNMLLFGASSGGARPKFTHKKDGLNWLVKPSVREDSFPMIRAEYLCLQAAVMLGLRPQGDHQRIETLPDVDALFVRRFDMTDAGSKHMVSMRSLLGRDNNTAGSYLDIADVLGKLSSNAKEDLKNLFRLMLLNCAVGNIDDHLKNFAMTWAKSDGWRLSPAYDITPAKMANPGGGGSFHSIGFFRNESKEESGKVPSSDDFRELGKLMGLSPTEIQTSINSVLEVSEWIGNAMGSIAIHGEQASLWKEDIQKMRGVISGCSFKSYPIPGR